MGILLKSVYFAKLEGRTNKVYERYRCRICGRLILRDGLHEEVRGLLSSLDFATVGCRYLEEALDCVWKLEEENNIGQMPKNKISSIQRMNNGLIDKLAVMGNPVVYRWIEDRIEVKTKQAEELELKLQTILDSEQE